MTYFPSFEPSNDLIQEIRVALNAVTWASCELGFAVAATEVLIDLDVKWFYQKTFHQDLMFEQDLGAVDYASVPTVPTLKKQSLARSRQLSIQKPLVEHPLPCLLLIWPPDAIDILLSRLASCSVLLLHVPSRSATVARALVFERILHWTAYSRIPWGRKQPTATKIRASVSTEPEYQVPKYLLLSEPVSQVHLVERNN